MNGLPNYGQYFGTPQRVDYRNLLIGGTMQNQQTQNILNQQLMRQRQAQEYRAGEQHEWAREQHGWTGKAQKQAMQTQSIANVAKELEEYYKAIIPEVVGKNPKEAANTFIEKTTDWNTYLLDTYKEAAQPAVSRNAAMMGMAAKDPEGWLKAIQAMQEKFGGAAQTHEQKLEAIKAGRRSPKEAGEVKRAEETAEAEVAAQFVGRTGMTAEQKRWFDTKKSFVETTLKKYVKSPPVYTEGEDVGSYIAKLMASSENAMDIAKEKAAAGDPMAKKDMAYLLKAYQDMAVLAGLAEPIEGAPMPEVENLEGQSYATPEAVRDAFSAGTISREEAKRQLRALGMQP